MSHRRRRPSSPPPVRAHPLEDDDLLHEILLRLPPQPTYLLRASIVSKRWRRLAKDPKFLSRYRIHHRKPPLLGHFSYEGGRFSFRSCLDPPYRIPPERFSLPPSSLEVRPCLDCRHGRVFFDDYLQSRVIVWDPITNDRRVIAHPPQFRDSGIEQIHSGAVLCAAGDQGHVHGACHSSPFKLVGLSAYHRNDVAIIFASVYSSDTGIWSDLVPTTLPWRGIRFSTKSALVGNTLHCLLAMDTILEFDLDTRMLAVTKTPPGAPPRHDNVQIIQSQDGGVGFAALSGSRYQPYLQMWDRKVDSHGAVTWVLQKTLELQKILGLESRIDKDKSSILHYLDDVQAIFLRVQSSLYMVDLESMQSKELSKGIGNSIYRPFTSFFTEGILQ
ncbi:F-box protein ETP1 isoform X2 [Lolium perenne]|uniref:F-box protein ETP1 isoform X1 n=1 Tax=Lolium perenne TaxID=4522 RepID=UPI0021F5332B|nr:uncharacterized protein LOC127344274 isoform X1 [Lolium perenne]XP_051226471.1 uncharacterized protein LOC127344274 isoform X2 [Lolium perenne]XP_051226472.1 uncharacterized protein LOC127344274 isoform X3 [Lolium perenne]